MPKRVVHSTSCHRHATFSCGSIWFGFFVFHPTMCAPSQGCPTPKPHANPPHHSPESHRLSHAQSMFLPRGTHRHSPLLAVAPRRMLQLQAADLPQNMVADLFSHGKFLDQPRDARRPARVPRPRWGVDAPPATSGVAGRNCFLFTLAWICVFGGMEGGGERERAELASSTHAASFPLPLSNTGLPNLAARWSSERYLQRDLLEQISG